MCLDLIEYAINIRSAFIGVMPSYACQPVANGEASCLTGEDERDIVGLFVSADPGVERLHDLT